MWLGNGPHLCTQFMTIGLFLLWGGKAGSLVYLGPCCYWVRHWAAYAHIAQYVRGVIIKVHYKIKSSIKKCRIKSFFLSAYKKVHLVVVHTLYIRVYTYIWISRICTAVSSLFSPHIFLLYNWQELRGVYISE